MFARMNGDEPDDQPGTSVRLDATSVRGLAHPLRVKILGFLRTEGAATATMLADRLGLNSGATSYHLRQLATYGFVVDDPERGVGRERWWRAAHAMTRWDNEELQAEGTGEAYLRSIAQVYIERIQGVVEQYGTLPVPWQRASTLSDLVLRLTPQEAEQLQEDLFEVLTRYRQHRPESDEPVPPESIPVSVAYQVIPHGHALPGPAGGTPEEDRDQSP